MKTETVKICAALAILLCLAAAQNLSPVVLGAKPPLLLLLGCIAGAPVAVGAGLFADALSGLPFGCSAVFFLAAALLARFYRFLAFPIAVSAAALYQIWMILWGGDTPMGSSCMAMVYAVLLYPVAQALFRRMKRFAGIDSAVKEESR